MRWPTMRRLPEQDLEKRLIRILLPGDLRRLLLQDHHFSRTRRRFAMFDLPVCGQ